MLLSNSHKDLNIILIYNLNQYNRILYLHSVNVYIWSIHSECYTEH